MNYQKTLTASTRAQVLVAGAGLGGIAAAIAAARAGADTLLIERNGYPGGVATAGHCCSLFNCFFKADGSQAVGGIPFEIACELANKAGGGEGWKRHRGHMIYDVEKAKTVLTEMLLREGVRVRYFTPLSDVITEDGRVKGVVVTGRNGLEYIEADTFVDATGDSDLAFHAGCPHRIIEGKASFLFRLGNVDMDRVVNYYRENPEEYIPEVDIDWDVWGAIRQYEETGTFLFPHGGGKAMSIFQNAIASGELSETFGTETDLDALQMHGIRSNGTIHIITGFTLVSQLDADTLTQRTHEGRKMAFYVADFMKKHIPGMENAYVASTADDLGVRFSRGITNSRRFTRQHQFSTEPLEDAIGKCLIVIAERRHEGKAWGCQSPGDACFEVPMGALIPDGVENVIMGAGRSISAQGYGLIRVMVNTMVVGQGAGTTAAVAALRGETVRDVNYPAVREALEKVGAFQEDFN
ncbi:MAG: FAD-dependent oxidoreductase [Ruminococcaceae bacterium]|nr:FAD-dependent oxidoreductase [Oscillospiraceae bacterium]